MKSLKDQLKKLDIEPAPTPEERQATKKRAEAKEEAVAADNLSDAELFAQAMDGSTSLDIPTKFDVDERNASSPRTQKSAADTVVLKPKGTPSVQDDPTDLRLFLDAIDAVDEDRHDED